MPSVSAFLLFALSAVAVKATNVTGDPTNLANWPPCAQKCIPIGLGPPVSCNSLSNLTCVCSQPAFTLAIASCEQTSCSTEELQQISALSDPLCAPVGGQPASVISEVSSYLATATLSASGLPTYPATLTAGTAASAIQATATSSPDRGNPADISTYPLCAQTCSNETAATAGCDAGNLDCVCAASFRSKTAACEQIICSSLDQQTTNLLAQQLCGPVYQNSPSLGSAVSSAIASATAVAASLKSLDPAKSANYPLCAQQCQNASIPASGCGSLSNRTCICKSPSLLNSNLGACERATCSASDLQITADLANALCYPVGGIGNTTNGSYTTSASTPTPSTFTGDATVMARSLGWGVMGLIGGLGWLVLL